MDTAPDYTESARGFFCKAQEELGAGDLVQASEKGWGAAAQMVKAVAASRGWPHQSHRHLIEAAGRLAEQESDDRVLELFQVASALHINFYENRFSRHMVEAGLRGVNELLDRLQRYLDGS